MTSMVRAKQKAKPKMGRKAASAPPHGSPGQILRILIKERAGERTHAQIAKAADLTPAKLSDILTGKAKSPGILTVQRILDALGANFCHYHKVAKKITESGNDRA
jgi:transcriptional regulator with XRE-family HTH domain